MLLRQRSKLAYVHHLKQKVERDRPRVRSGSSTTIERTNQKLKGRVVKMGFGTMKGSFWECFLIALVALVKMKRGHNYLLGLAEGESCSNDCSVCLHGGQDSSGKFKSPPMKKSLCS